MTDIDKAAERLQSCHPQGRSVDFRDLLAGVERFFFAHETFAEYYRRVDTDFIYDRHSGLYLAGLRRADPHTALLAALHCHWTVTAGGVHEDADRFVLRGYGLLKSRAGPRVYCGPTFELLPAQAFLQRDLEILQ